MSGGDMVLLTGLVVLVALPVLLWMAYDIGYDRGWDAHDHPPRDDRRAP